MTSAADSGASPQEYPGERLGLPATGRGSLAGWGSRIAALVVDWVVCTAIAVFLFGGPVLTGHGWRSWTILAAFFVESMVLSVLAGGSVGQLVCRIAVVRVDRTTLRLPYAAVRSALVCLVLPLLVVGVDRRSLHDIAAGTVVVNRR